MQRTMTDTGLDVAKWTGGAAAGALVMYLLDPERGGARRARSVAAVRGAGTRASGALGNAWRGAGTRPGAAAGGLDGTAAAAVDDGEGDTVGNAASSVTSNAGRAKTGARLAAAAGDIADAVSNPAGPDGRAAGTALKRVGKAVGQVLDETMSSAKRAFAKPAAGRARTGNAADDAGDALPSAARAGPAARRLAANLKATFSPSAGDAEGAWPPALRNAVLLGGGLLAANAVLRRSPFSLVMGLAGAALLARGGTNQPLRRLASARGLRLDQAIDIERSIHVDAAPAEVYDLFADYENYPRFMSHVLDVRDLGRRRSHWTVKGPADSKFEWNSVVTEQNRPYRLAWRSEPGAEIPQSGSIQFEARRGGTDVTVRMSYSPPAGALGHGLATLIGADPASRLEEDLAHMKGYVEHGAAPDEDAQHRRQRGERGLHGRHGPRGRGRLLH